MFLINILDLFKSLDFIYYIFGAFGFLGINLAVQYLVMRKRI